MKTPPPARVRITTCRRKVLRDAGIKRGDVCCIARPPLDQRNWDMGIWIKVDAGRIKIFYDEFIMEWESMIPPAVCRTKHASG